MRLLPRALRSGGARRARWGIVDQALSSVTNFGVTAVAARYANPEEFGAFSLAFALYILSLWISRSLVAEPYVVRLTRSDITAQRHEGARALGTAAVLGMVAAAVMFAVTVVTGATPRLVLVAMGLGMPFLLVQDTYRYLLIAGDRTKAAVANDAIWLGLQSAIVAALLVSGRPGVTGLTVAFGGAAAVASAAGWLQTRIRPMVRAAPDWLHRFRDLGLPFLYELIMINGILQITVLAIGLFGEVVTVGQLRAGTLVFAPLTVMFAGVFLIGLPEAVKLGETPARVLRLVVTIGVLTSLATCVWAVLIALVPARLGVDALGANWAPARDLVVPIGVLTTAAAWMLAIAVGLRAVGASRQSLRLRSVGAPVIFVLGTAGAVLDGSSGAAAGLAIGACVSAMLAWITFRRAIGTTAP